MRSGKAGMAKAPFTRERTNESGNREKTLGRKGHKASCEVIIIHNGGAALLPGAISGGLCL